MTTKFKIILGFLVMILLLGGVAVFGYLALQAATGNFGNYRWHARANVSASDMISSMNKALLKTFDFMRRADGPTLDEGMKAADAFADIAKAAEEESQIAYRKEGFRAMQQRVPAFKATQAAVCDNLAAFRQHYEGGVLAAYDALEKLLGELGGSTASMQNYEALHTMIRIQGRLSRSMNALGSFSQSASRADQQTSQDQLAQLKALLTELEPQLMSQGGRTIYSKLVAAYGTLEKAVEGMKTGAEGLRASILDLRKQEKEISEFMDAFNGRVDSEMRATGTLVLEENAAAQRNMMIASLVGVLVGVAFTLLIVYGIVRVLGDLSGFAGAIARGDFTYRIRTREKGEIGSVVQAMQHIPATLRQIIDTANTLANDIRVGRLRNRLHQEDFPGAFADLAVAVNTVGNAFTELVDNLPVPIMACDKDRKVNFFNKSAQDMAGGNHVGKHCGDLIKTAECNTGKCMGRQCVEKKDLVSLELPASPQGKNLDVSITALPLTGASGAVEGFIEIITDLTEIKSQQRVMLRVAGEAAEISNRVAAASEELSAQVEQVSRGAEMQRDRVESTASAMTEMNSTVLEVARSAGEASEQSENTRQKADSGSSLVNRVVQAMNQVNAVTVTLQGNMQELGGHAESIGGVMNVISDIADQTNLLALNAAIEAARAGEAGRGFAVVADEVRKLAEKTMEATHEVGSRITAIQHSAHVNIEEVGNAVKNITEATELAHSSGEALQEIVNLASANSAVVASIATAAEEQSATSEEINRAIEEINHIVGETTDGMVQSSAAVQELSRMAQELRRVMEGLQ